MARYNVKVHRLTGKEYLSVLEWVRDNQDDLVANRTSYVDAAKACSKELDIECSTPGLRRVVDDWDDIVWKGARNRGPNRGRNGADDEMDVETRVALLESRVGVLEQLLSGGYSG